MITIEIEKDNLFPDHYSAVVTDVEGYAVDLISYGKTLEDALYNMAHKLEDLGE